MLHGNVAASARFEDILNFNAEDATGVAHHSKTCVTTRFGINPHDLSEIQLIAQHNRLNRRLPLDLKEPLKMIAKQ